MNKNGKTEKLIDTDCRKIFSEESTVLSVYREALKIIEKGRRKSKIVMKMRYVKIIRQQESSPVPNPGRSFASAILSGRRCLRRYLAAIKEPPALPRGARTVPKVQE